MKRTAYDCSWSPPPSGLMLSDDEVHVWRDWLDRPTFHLQTLYRMLSLDERHRAERFRFERDRNRFIARRGLLGMILARYLGLDSESLRFCYGPNGKPSLELQCNPWELSFNMSHSDGLPIYAINRKRKIGVDVERVRPVPESDKIVEDVFPGKPTRLQESTSEK